MNRVIHFEIHAINPEKMVTFYTDVFGWRIEEWKMAVEIPHENRYWNIYTSPEGSKDAGINGGMVIRRGAPPKGGETVTSYICTIDVSNLDEHIKKIEAAGGKNVVPKMAVPGLAWLAYCSDIEGNIFGIYQEDKTAK